MIAQPPADPAARTVDEDEGQPDDDGRDGQRQVDHGVQDPLAGEVVTDQQHGEADAEDRVADDRDHRDGDGQPEGVDRVGLGERVPHRTRAVLDGPPEHEADGQHQ